MMPKRPQSRTYWRQQDKITTVRSAIDFYSTQRRLAGIAPARATWRELRFTFVQSVRHPNTHDIKESELWEMLETLIRWGCVKRYRGIVYDTYEMDWEAMRKFERMTIQT